MKYLPAQFPEISWSICFLAFVRFEKVEALGTAVLGKTPGATDVKDKMKKLADDKQTIDEMYQKRLKDLQDAYDLQVRSCTLLYRYIISCFPVI